MGGKCNVLLVADKVIREDNGKRGIIGAFNSFNIPQFPWIVPPFFIYANIEDFEGDQEFSVNIVREGSDFVIFSFGGELHSLVPEREAELLIPVVNLQVPKEGVYNLILKIAAYPYGSRRLIMNKATQTGQVGG
jgi:hypothetical protein